MSVRDDGGAIKHSKGLPCDGKKWNSSIDSYFLLGESNDHDSAVIEPFSVLCPPVKEGDNCCPLDLWTVLMIVFRNGIKTGLTITHDVATAFQYLCENMRENQTFIKQFASNSPVDQLPFRRNDTFRANIVCTCVYIIPTVVTS